MCTRFALLEQHYREILERYGIGAATEYLSRYNVAPGSKIPAIRPKSASPEKGKNPADLEVVQLRWGLVSAWSKSDEGGLTNARAETIAEKPSFRDVFRTRRCLIPATGFYEWEHRGQAKQPWLFRRRDGRPFGLAGLWSSWRSPDGTPLETCAVITTEPNELIRPIHHRMPVMLSGEQMDAWLDPSRTELAQLTPLIQVADPAAMTALAVSTYMSNSRHEGPACLEPATSGGNGSPQLSLDF